jgi:hypothetical protein
MRIPIHRIYIFTLTAIIVVSTILLAYYGFPYYNTNLVERFYHPDHDLFKASGLYGHGLGIAGTLFIIFGVFSYMARKRYRFLSRFGRLKYWLEFHIFLCILGPVLILFHTSFKFGGIVAISFWSMVIVVASGVIGRFIYIRIPRTIEGREMSLAEVRTLKNEMHDYLKDLLGGNEKPYQTILELTGNRSDAGNRNYTGNFLKRRISKYISERNRIGRIREILRSIELPKPDIRKAVRLVKSEISLNNRIGRLHTLQKLFRYWHIAHLPFALIMLVIMVIHVGIALAFGATWIF